MIGAQKNMLWPIIDLNESFSMNIQERPLKNQPTPPDDAPILELKDRVYFVYIRRRTLIIILVGLVAWSGVLWGHRAHQRWTQAGSSATTKAVTPASPVKPFEPRRNKSTTSGSGQNEPTSSAFPTRPAQGEASVLVTPAMPDQSASSIPVESAASPPPLPSSPPKVSFYHWRTVYQPGETSLTRLRELDSDRLYLRFFEVTTTDSWPNAPRPQATIVFSQTPSLPVAPVVYIDLEVLLTAREYQIVDLSGRLVKRVMDIAKAHDLKLVKELHLDCDWTTSTQEKFFALTAAVKKDLPPDWQLAVTLRLDQFKNHQITGVPPADKGVLMAYNMGNLRQPGPLNSILSPKVAAEYLISGQSYPLPLDVALPLFSWVVVFDEQDTFQGLLRTIPPELKNREYCRPGEANLFYVEQPFTTPEGGRVPAGWHLRLEENQPDDLMAVAGLLAKAVPYSQHLIFYHLDDSVLEKWPAKVLEDIAGQSHNVNL
jgi:hypothetical protein